jgi:UDP-GlcNAc:undecaprenyl-phosphate/decaprenyl-phosphate GlcNAc-1-phosphate transferase
MEQIIHRINIESLAFFIFGFSFIISYLIIPKLISVIRFKNLMDGPNLRSSHFDKTPTLGGVVFYISLVFGLFVIHYYDVIDISFNILVGLTVLFFVGIKDDLVVLSAKSKVLAQLLAITFILINPDLHIVSFHGFFGITEILFFLTIAFSYFIMIFIINSYNLMDGIDGLAAMLGIVIFTIYAIFFYRIELIFYFLLSVISIGFLIAFLRFNLSKKRKIFMGDTGSMIVGFLIGIMTLRFLALKVTELEKLHIDSKNCILIVFAILFFPVIDVVRVIIMRLINKRKAFSPDRCHMHHILVDKGLSHVKASVILTISSVIIFLVIFLTNTYLSVFGLVVLFFILTFFTFYILLLLDSDRSANKYRKKFKSLFPRSFQIREFRIRKRIIITLKSLFFKNML